MQVARNIKAADFATEIFMQITGVSRDEMEKI